MLTLVAIKDLKAGDLIDLENDRYADPDGVKVEYQSEYSEVDEIDQETDTCIVVYFTSTQAVGFPPDHKVKREDDCDPFFWSSCD
jgi:hypothetical protein